MYFKIMKKISSRLIYVLLSAIFVLSMVSCSGTDNNSDKNIDTEALAQEVLAIPDAKFSEMVLVNESKIDNYYPILDTSKLSDVKIYIEGARANADQFAVFKVNEASDIEMVKAAIKDHSDTTLESVKSYKPEEKPRIENALLITKGNYVFYAISEDNAQIEKVINNYFK